MNIKLDISESVEGTMVCESLWASRGRDCGERNTAELPNLRRGRGEALRKFGLFNISHRNGKIWDREEEHANRTRDGKYQKGLRRP